MIFFFTTQHKNVLAVQASQTLEPATINKLQWLFGNALLTNTSVIENTFVGPRKEMITPWSTNAVEITQNMAISGITRIEEFFLATSQTPTHDPMLQRVYKVLDQSLFDITQTAAQIVNIDNIAAYNQQEGLALSEDEIAYLEKVSAQAGRKLTDSEVFGFSQVNSEHCRHKIFNGIFVIDGVERESTLFQLIKLTAKVNPNKLVSSYTDNVAFNAGPCVEQFAPISAHTADFFQTKKINTVISIKAETHNFPTTVEPFNGAATGTGGEIRDRMGGGKSSIPIAGTAVYMTSYPRNSGGQRIWEKPIAPRQWLYQTPEQLLIKASNGASDFGNKFGQPLICGSLLTFEHQENDQTFGYDKVIMLAGGIGFSSQRDALKGQPQVGQKVVVMGGDNYRIGMGGSAVSSVDTGLYNNDIELNAVQRANPEMQKRVSNVIRALAESETNPVVSIHDHGAGGHLNCLSELIEHTGGCIDIGALPVGDPTLSAKEIIGNESQERMGLLMDAKDIPQVQQIADRERAPLYVVGSTTGDMQLEFAQAGKQSAIKLPLDALFGKPPRTYMHDNSVEKLYHNPQYESNKILQYIENVLRLEAVACKDWLTNKVDRSVTGRVARQQCQGEIQLPLSDCGVVALDYRGKAGIATSIGHAPQAALADAAKGSILAVAEALTNIVFAPLTDKINSVSLSANWMWPCRNQGEDARLYEAVEALSNFCIELGVNVPTGKDSLSMTQKYGEKKVFAPGTVIVSAGAEVSDVRKVVSQVLINNTATCLYHIDFSQDRFQLGGSAFAQSLNSIGMEVPTVIDPEYFAIVFNTLQTAVNSELILAGHDVSAGGMITCLLEMCFGNNSGGIDLDLDLFEESDLIKLLFSENPAVIIQVEQHKQNIFENLLQTAGVVFGMVGRVSEARSIQLRHHNTTFSIDINAMRKIWFETSYLLDKQQVKSNLADVRFEQFDQQALHYAYPKHFTGKLAAWQLTADRSNRSGIVAAIIRDKGTNGDREMAYALYLAGFDVKDIHMTDLTTGRENLEDVKLIVFCGGFSNSDVLGSAKGWAGGFLYNEKAKAALDNFYKRSDTLSLGICNGCQLMMELNLIYPEREIHPKMDHNKSGKYESQFITVEIPENNSVMLSSLAGSRLGVWVAHGEGQFILSEKEDQYQIIAKYAYSAYPANPNGSRYDVAGICSQDGRHLAMMPHPERAIFPWQNAHYDHVRVSDEVTPWMELFVNAQKWIRQNK